MTWYDMVATVHLASAEVHSEKEMLLILCPNLSLWWSLVISGDVTFINRNNRNRTSQGSGGNWISGNNDRYSSGYNTGSNHSVLGFRAHDGDPRRIDRRRSGNQGLDGNGRTFKNIVIIYIYMYVYIYICIYIYMLSIYIYMLSWHDSSSFGKSWMDQLVHLLPIWSP